MFVGRFRPLEREIDAQAVRLVEEEWQLVHRLCASSRDDRLQAVAQTFGALEGRPPFRGLVFGDGVQALVQKAPRTQPSLYALRLEFDLREKRLVLGELDGPPG